MVGKADTLTPEELGTFKKQIMNQIRQSNIKIYEFPQEKEINAKLPFAVVGSNCVLDINGEKIRGRRYPWGVVNVSIKLGSTSLLRIIVIEDLGTLIVYLIKGILMLFRT